MKGTSATTTTPSSSIVYPKMINHIAVSVTDLDQAIKWYKEVLGFTMVRVPLKFIATIMSRLSLLCHKNFLMYNYIFCYFFFSKLTITILFFSLSKDGTSTRNVNTETDLSSLSGQKLA